MDVDNYLRNEFLLLYGYCFHSPETETEKDDNNNNNNIYRSRKMEGGQLLQLWKRIFRQWFDSTAKFDSSKPTLDNSFSILHLSIRHRFRSRTKWKKKRAYLSRMRNFNRIRPSRGSTSIVFTAEDDLPFHSREPRRVHRFPNSRKTYVRSSQRMRLWLVKEETGGHRLQASKNKRSRRDARERRNRCCVWRRRRRGGLCR